VSSSSYDDASGLVGRALRVTDDYMDYTGSDDDFVLDYAEEYLEYDFQQLYGGQWPDTSWEVVDESSATNRFATMRGYIWNDEMDAYMWTVIYWDTSYNNVMAKTFFVPSTTATIGRQDGQKSEQHRRVLMGVMRYEETEPCPAGKDAG